MKKISSTEAKTNFGHVLDDVLNHTLYVVERHGTAKAIILSFYDFDQILSDTTQRKKMLAILEELRPRTEVGKVINPKTMAK